MLRKTKALATVAVLAVAVAACSSSGGSQASAPSGTVSGSSGTAAGSPEKTITIGLLTDVTGPAASGNKLSEVGVKAGVVYAARNGYRIKYVEADTQTNPGAVVAAAQKLVLQDHVSAVIAHSALAFAAAPFLTKENIPVVGVAEDGPEWLTAKNMFSVWGALDNTLVPSTTGLVFKLLGAKTIGTLGYSISPLSSDAAKSAALSAKAAGLKVGYVNANFAFGSTDVQPEALAMKSHGVDGITTATDANTAYALVKALKNLGNPPKAVVLASGYGVDTLQAGPGALKEAQNVYFTLIWEPVELHTAATKQFQADLKAVGFTSVPSVAIYGGYTSVVLLVRALKAADGATDHAALIKALSQIHDWNAAGLFGSRTIDINQRGMVGGTAPYCYYVSKLVGSGFETVPNAEPVCGDLVPGEKVGS